MVSKGVIQEYIADINFAVLGYRIYYIFTKHEVKNSSVNTKDSGNKRKMIIEHINHLGYILAEIQVLGGISIFRVATREVNNEITLKYDDSNIISLLNTGLIEKAVPASNTRSLKTGAFKRRQQPYPTPTALKIIKCLVLNPQIGLTDIARLVSVSTRTSNRILNKLRDDGIVRFSIICNPAAMKGLVIFGLLIYINMVIFLH